MARIMVTIVVFIVGYRLLLLDFLQFKVAGREPLGTAGALCQELVGRDTIANRACFADLDAVDGYD